MAGVGTRSKADGRTDPKILANRYVWWQPASESLASPEILLRQILKMGTADDYVAAREHWGEQAFRAALITAPPGSLDERSWVFWYRHYDLPLKPFPKRSFS
jgi:hypothetical protein